MKRQMLYIDGSPNDRGSLQNALQFHRKFGGRLDVAFLRLPDAKVGSVTRAIDVAQRAVMSAKQAYDEVCGGLESTAWLKTEDDFEEMIRHQGRLHDLTILERVSNDEGPEVSALNTALFDTGGPVMVSPPAPLAAVGEHVALVWSPTAQSARALRSALPVLTQAAKVSTLTNSANAAARPGELAAYLADHGVAAESVTFDGAKLTARGRGRAILAAAEEIAADLIVMGAYGENRLKSIVGLGRATRKIVSGSPVPVLLQT